MRSLSAFVLRGRSQALVVVCGLAFASLLISPLSLLSSALFALVGLRQTAKDSALTLLLALLALGLSGVLLGGSSSAVLYGALLWLPVWPVAVVLRESLRLELAVETALALGLAAVLGVYGFVDEPATLWRHRLQDLAQAMLGNSPAINMIDLGRLLDWLAHYATGAAVGGSVMSLILALLIGRWQQAVLFNPGGFRSEFIALRLHDGVAYALLACMLVAALSNGGLAELSMNCLVVIAMVFTVVGFAIIHHVLGGKNFWIAGIYVVLLFLPHLLLPPITLLGFSDTWLDWRKQTKRDSAGRI
jgi:hypothetical protein